MEALEPSDSNLLLTMELSEPVDKLNMKNKFPAGKNLEQPVISIFNSYPVILSAICKYRFLSIKIKNKNIYQFDDPFECLTE